MDNVDGVTSLGDRHYRRPTVALHRLVEKLLHSYLAVDYSYTPLQKESNNVIKKYLHNSKGLTLLELLAVVVILGIISVIAILAIVNIIANTKKDAHIANAILLANEAKKYTITEHIHIDDSTGKTITLKTLIDEEYMSPIKDPNSNGYYDENFTDVIITKDGDKYVYKVALIGPNNSFTYTNHAKEVFLLTRDDIHTP